MKIDKRLVLTTTIGIVVTVLVYIGIVTSLERPTLSRLPISKEDAISIMIAENLGTFNRGDLVTEFVYIRGNGSFYESDVNSNHVGKHLGDAEPTVNSANYFAWKITNKKDSTTYFLDSLNGEIVSKMR
jgi:hypothetical protein